MLCPTLRLMVSMFMVNVYSKFIGSDLSFELRIRILTATLNESFVLFLSLKLSGSDCFRVIK